MTILNRKTRSQFLHEKKEEANTYPFAVAAINFQFDGNLGFIIRSAACFGAQEVLVVGALPSRRKLRQLSASTNDFIEIKQFSRPSELLRYNREVGYNNVAIELCDDSKNIYKYNYPQGPTCIITGNETYGVPAEILHSSQKLIIPMPGIGKCLNTSQAATCAMYEWQRQNS